MARGWESKSVESQQADRESSAWTAPVWSEEERARRAKHDILVLSRLRVAADLEAARNPAHRAMLEAALRAIDGQLQGE